MTDQKDSIQQDLLPDLVPLKYAANYCHLDSQCRLVITVKNQGFKAAPASITRVVFFGAGDMGILDIPTPAVPPQEQLDLDPVAIPPLKTMNILFTITVDARNEVLESNKRNNAVEGFCLSSTACPLPSLGP